MILKSNPIVLLFIQNNSYFKNKLKHVYLHQCQFYVIISSSAGCVAADPRIVSTRRLRVSATQATPSSNSWKIQDIKECLGWHAFFKSHMSSVKLFFCCSCYVVCGRSTLSSPQNVSNVLPFTTALPKQHKLVPGASRVPNYPLLLTSLFGYRKRIPNLVKTS